MQWVPEVLYLGAKRPVSEFAPDLHLVAMLRISSALPLLPLITLWCPEGQYYFTFTLESHTRKQSVRIFTVEFCGLLMTHTDG
jgi:hypothetical protein